MLVTRHVDIPERLMLAQEHGRLVLFVGAGASAAPPSSLPTFVGLAEAIATDTNSALTKEDEKDPSRFLSRLADDGIQVHQLAHTRVSQSAAPNRLHEALVDLFPAPEALRIVTTNWDSHLTTAATAKFGQRPPVYNAPALPLGRDFTGIVHLHGGLDQGPQGLIMTESDFGRAYLTDAYAARFVHEMFCSYTVLFIGYSNDDVIMYHLGRGLSTRAQPRYGAISHGKPLDKWNALGIAQILYPPANGHVALVEGLEKWAWLIQSGHLEYERRVIKLLASAIMPRVGDAEKSGIAWDPADDSFMQRVVSDPERVELFTTHAEADVRLLKWIEDKPAFQELFSSLAPLTPVGFHISSWFASRFAAVKPDAAIAIIHQRGGRLHPRTASLIAAAISGAQATPRIVAQWLPVLLGSDISASALGTLLGTFNDDAQLDVGVLLFDRLVAPRPILRSLMTGDGKTGPGVDVVLTGDDYELRRAWSGYFAPRIDVIAAAFVPMAERHLRTAHLFIRAEGRAGRNRDILSLGRASVSPSVQTEPGPGIDLIVDIARKSMTALGRVSPHHAQTIVNVWVDDNVPLLRRLAIYCYAQRDDVSSDAKIDWLVEAGVLYDELARPEAYDLLAAHISHASDVREKLLTAVLNGPGPSVAPEHHDQPVMSLLSWLTRHSPDYAEAEQALAALQLTHPDFTPSQHPSRIFAFTMMSLGEQSPRSAEQLRRMTAPGEIDWLREYQGEPGFEGPNRAGLLWEVSRAVAADTPWSLTIASRLADETDWDSDLWPVIFQGWKQALPSATNEHLTSMLDPLGAAAGLPAVFPETASLLAAITGRPDVPPAIVDRCEKIATALWHAAREQNGAGLPSLEARDDKLLVWSTVEHWIGGLTVVFIQIAAQRWQLDRDAWTGLPPILRETLEQLLEVTFLENLGVLAVATRSLALLCALDEQWTAEHIVPSFDWDQQGDVDHRRALAAWQGFLTHPAWNEGVLGLLEPYFADAFDGMTGELRTAVVETMSNIAIGASTHDELIEHLTSIFVSKATDEERAHWARNVGWLLGKISPQDAEAAWEAWLLAYWRHRLGGVPRGLSATEAQEMLTWVPTAGHHFPAAAAFLTCTDTIFERAHLFFKRLAGHALLTEYPLDASKLVAFVLAHCNAPTSACHEIGTVITALIGNRNQSSHAYLKAACNDARRLGCGHAMDWLRSIEGEELL